MDTETFDPHPCWFTWHVSVRSKGIRELYMRVVQRSMAIAGLMLIFTGGTICAQPARMAISSPQPVYPELAKRMHLTGVVKVTLIVGADGQIKNVEFQGGHPLLIESVQSALKQWKYAPASSESKILIEFRF
jgi:TonB family protein